MIKINGETWQVLLVSPDYPMLLRSVGTYALGVCDDDLKTIYINNELSEHKMKNVLCHELTHAAMFRYNIELSIEQEEILADLLATYGQEIIDMTNTIFNRLTKKWEDV